MLAVLCIGCMLYLWSCQAVAGKLCERKWQIFAASFFHKKSPIIDVWQSLKYASGKFTI